MVREFAVLAVNHGGFQVENFDPQTPEKGWFPAIEEKIGYEDDQYTPIYKPLEPYKDEATAISVMNYLKDNPYLRKDLEYRVYPVAVEKVKK